MAVPDHVRVTIEDVAGRRTYGGDYAYVFVAKQTATDNIRFLQTPVGWEKDSGLFHAAVTALLNLAETKGESRIQKASREMLAIFDKYDPNKELPEKCLPCHENLKEPEGDKCNTCGDEETADVCSDSKPKLEYMSKDELLALCKELDVKGDRRCTEETLRERILKALFERDRPCPSDI